MNIQISNYEQIDNIGKGNIQIFGKYSLQDQHNYLIIIAIYTCERKKNNFVNDFYVKSLTL